MQESTNRPTREDLGAEVARLKAEFQGVFGETTIERYVTESVQRLSSSYLPLFLHRFTSERLRALAQSRGELSKEVPEVLFVCVHNSGRSLMAAALLERAVGDRVHVRTAGSEPAGEINPAVIVAMRDVGLEVSGEFPKPLTDEFVGAADVVVTMGCGEACPIYEGKHYEDWELDDPDDADLDGVRAIRDEIERRVEDLAERMHLAGR